MRTVQTRPGDRPDRPVGGPRACSPAPSGWACRLAGRDAAAALVTAAGLLARASTARAAGARAADRVTLTRATLVGGVTALVADALVGPAPVAALVGLAVVALVLDGVDGWVARRTGTVSALGRALRHGGRRVPDPGAQRVRRADRRRLGARHRRGPLPAASAAGRVLPWLRAAGAAAVLAQGRGRDPGHRAHRRRRRTCCRAPSPSTSLLARGHGAARRVVRPRGVAAVAAPRAATRRPAARPRRGERRSRDRVGPPARSRAALPVVGAPCSPSWSSGSALVLPDRLGRLTPSAVPAHPARGAAAGRRSSCVAAVAPGARRRGGRRRRLLGLLTVVQILDLGFYEVLAPAVQPGDRLALPRRRRSTCSATRSARRAAAAVVGRRARRCRAPAGRSSPCAVLRVGRVGGAPPGVLGLDGRGRSGCVWLRLRRRSASSWRRASRSPPPQRRRPSPRRSGPDARDAARPARSSTAAGGDASATSRRTSCSRACAARTSSSSSSRATGGSRCRDPSFAPT